MEMKGNMDSSRLSIIIIFLFFYHLSHSSSWPLLSFPLLPFVLCLLLNLYVLSLPSSQLALLALPPTLPGIAAAAVSFEAAQEVGPEAAEGAGVASRPVGRGHVLLQAAGQEEGELAVLTAVRTLHLVAALHMCDGETCEDT